MRGGVLRGPAPLSHPNTPPPSAFPRKTRPARHKTPIFGSLEHAGRTFSRSRVLLAEQGEKSRVQCTPTRDFETHNTNARPRTATIETGNTTATERCPKNAHFAPAKATTVSVEARPAPAKATGVSDNRPSWPTGPGGGARGRRRGLAGRPVGGRRYKRRQTNAIQIASRGPLLQTSSIQAQKPPFSAKKPMD